MSRTPNADVEIDELDENILNELLADGRKSFRQIAESVGSTPATVINRVNRLQEEDVVRGYTVDLDYERLGFNAIAAIEIVVKGDQAEAVEQDLHDHNNVVSLFSITGDTDILMMVKFRTQEELTDFVRNEVLASSRVEKTITHMAFDIYKEGKNPRF